MSEKIVLIDGHSILHRAFYGVPDLTNSQGLHTNAVYGFLNIMLKILEEEKPDFLTVAFDVHEPTFRHKMYAAYKGTRKPMPAELSEQIPVLQQMLDAMRVPVVTKGGLEADDILGTIAVMAQARGMEVSLVSGDRDLLQLATDDILIRIPKTKRGGTEIENYRAAQVMEKYSVTPKQIVDMKGLMGDASDNIPGVPGIGEKTAVKLLNTFPTVEAVYENLEAVEPKRVRELLRANKELAFLSKRLAAIQTDCEIDFSFEEAKYENIFTPEAFAWVKKLELKSLEDRFDTSVRTAGTTEQESVMLRLTTQEQAAQYIDGLLQVLGSDGKPAVVGVGFLGDVCRTGCPLLGMSVSYQAETVQTACLFVSEGLPAEFLLVQYRRIAQAAGTVVLADWKAALHITEPYCMEDCLGVFPDETLSQLEALFDQVFDVSVGAYLLNPLQDSYQVDDIARDFLQETVPSYADCFGKQKLADLAAKEAYTAFLAGDGDEAFGKNMLQYAGNLSRLPLLSYGKITEQLRAQGMDALMRKIEMPTAYYLYQMEREGVCADRAELENMSKLLAEKEAALETDIYDMAGEEFNINSPKQLGTILFEKLKLPYAKKTKTGYSTAADILEKLKNEDPIVARILEYRQIAKLKSTYADGLVGFIREDGRIHGTFNQTITATGRISSNNPNLQNIPVRMELGREIRKVFYPKQGCVFVDADYSQIELRVLAHMSGDERLIEAYRQNQDIHRSTASRVFHTPFDEVTDLQRRNAKAVNFGIIYGMSAFGLSQDLNISKKEAQGYIDRYFAMYPEVKAFIDGLVDKAKKKGYSETIFGRRRPIPELSSSNFMQRSFGERVAMNAPIQGTAADIIKLAMVRVANRMKKEGLRSKVVLQVHDELLVEAWEAEKETVKQILLEEMPAAAELSVPLVVEVKEGKNWKEAH